MKKSSIIMMSDEVPTDDEIVKLALAHAHHERTGRIGFWINRGDVSIVYDHDPVNVRLQIGDQFFAEPRDVFPSEVLVANIALALAAGLKNRPPIEDYHASDSLSYGVIGRSPRFEPAFAETMEAAYHNVAKFTATVKRKKLAKVQP
jgi:hypothetical protein